MVLYATIVVWHFSSLKQNKIAVTLLSPLTSISVFPSKKINRLYYYIYIDTSINKFDK